MSYEGKTDWKLDDLVMPEDMNRIEQGILDNDKLLYLIKTIFPAISSSNVFTVTISSGIISSMSDLIGVPLKIKANADSSSAVSLQINSFGAYSLKKSNGNDVTNLKANGIYTVVWNGVNFQLLGEGGEYGTATPTEVLKGYTIGTEEGIKTGTLELTGNATAADTLAGKTFYNTNAKVKETGTMPNQGAVSHTLTNQGASYTIPKGYHNGNGVVNANITNLIAANIKAGVTVGGVLGTFTSDATATASQILSGYTAYSNGSKITGTMTNRGAWNGTITLTSSTSGTVTIPSGFHNGSGKVTATASDADLIASNIRSGKNILGVTGTLIEATGNANTGDVLSGKTFSKAGSAGLTGTMSNHGAKVITPSTVNQAIPAGYHNGQGYVKGDTNLIASNIKNGVTIFGVTGNHSGLADIYTTQSIESGEYANQTLFTITGGYMAYVFLPDITITGYSSGMPPAYYDMCIQGSVKSSSSGGTCLAHAKVYDGNNNSWDLVFSSDYKSRSFFIPPFVIIQHGNKIQMVYIARSIDSRGDLHLREKTHLFTSSAIGKISKIELYFESSVTLTGTNFSTTLIVHKFG